MSKYLKAYYSAVASNSLPGKFLEKVYFDGTVYFDTGFAPRITSEMFIDFQSTVIKTMFMCGVRYAYNNLQFCLANNWVVTSEGYLFQLGAGTKSTQSMGIATEATERQTMLLKLEGSEMNGTVIPHKFTWQGTRDYKIYLGKLNQIASADTRSFVGYMWNFYLKTNGEYMLNWKPFQHNDGTIGMWDEVTQTFIAPTQGTLRLSE